MLFFDHIGYGYKKNLCKKIVSWFFSKYLPRHNVELVINHRGLSKENVLGWAVIENEVYRPRTFLIEIQSRLDDNLYSITLLHELWHVYQWVKGDLKEIGSKRVWKGKDHTSTIYKDQPWELEAEKMEQVLMKKFMSKLGS